MPIIDSNQLRTTHIADSNAIGLKQRHGFFSVPISTAIGDDGPYKTQIHPRNEMGKPQTSPRNFQTSPPRSGQLNKSFLGQLNSLATSVIKDEYIEVPKRLVKEDHESRRLSQHQRVFYPSSNSKIQHRPAYQYKQETNPQKNSKRNRQEDGKVKVKARQLQTNIQSKVISDYFKPIKNISDPYNRAHDIKWQYQKNQKLKEGQVPFSPNKFRTDYFHRDQQVFNDHEIKRTRYEKSPSFNILKHENRWRDTNSNRKGLYGFFTPFPQYKQNPLRQVTRTQKGSDKEIFKSMNRTTLGIPCPSITQHPLNLARSLHHSFSHRP